MLTHSNNLFNIFKFTYSKKSLVFVCLQSYEFLFCFVFLAVLKIELRA
jgi:hypothetical protein